jgi:hypothetical protein
MLQLFLPIAFGFAFMVYAGWKLRHGPVERSWTGAILVDAAAVLVAVAIAFVLSLGFQHDLKTSLRDVSPILLMALLMVPIDLLWSARKVLLRIRADQEWANLQIN